MSIVGSLTDWQFVLYIKKHIIIILVNENINWIIFQRNWIAIGRVSALTRAKQITVSYVFKVIIDEVNLR